MKKFVLACVTAAALLAASQQKASAWCEFNFGVGMNIGFKSGGCNIGNGCFSTTPAPMYAPMCAPCCPAPCDPCLPQMPHAAAAPYYYGQPQYVPAAQQQPQVQQAGYHYYGNQYDQAAVPAYWYER